MYQWHGSNIGLIDSSLNTDETRQANPHPHPVAQGLNLPVLYKTMIKEASLGRTFFWNFELSPFRGPIWARLDQALNRKWERSLCIISSTPQWWLFILHSLRDAKICDLHTKARWQASPLFPPYPVSRVSFDFPTQVKIEGDSICRVSPPPARNCKI